MAKLTRYVRFSLRLTAHSQARQAPSRRIYGKYYSTHVEAVEEKRDFEFELSGESKQRGELVDGRLRSFDR